MGQIHEQEKWAFSFFPVPSFTLEYLVACSASYRNDDKDSDFCNEGRLRFKIWVQTLKSNGENAVNQGWKPGSYCPRGNPQHSDFIFKIYFKECLLLLTKQLDKSGMLLLCIMLSRVWLVVTPWTVACQAPLSMGFSRQEHWSGLPFPSPGIFLTQELNLSLLCLLHCRRVLYPLSHREHRRGWDGWS